MAAEWFCEIAGKELGPLSSQQLKAMVEKGRLTAKHRVRQGSEGPWVPAGRVKGLFSTAGSPPLLPGKTDVPVAKPLEETVVPSAAEAKPAPRRAVKLVDVPVAQPMADPSDRPPAARAQVPRAKAAAAPPLPPNAATGDPQGANQFGIVVEANKAGTTATGRSSAGSTNPKRKRQQNIILVGSLAVLVIGLAVAGIVVAIVGNPFGESPSQAGQRAANAASDADKEIEAFENLAAESPVKPTGATSSAEPTGTKWLDASKAAVRRERVEVRISSTRIGVPRVIQSSGRAARPTRGLLLIAVTLKNLGSDQSVNYTSWGGNSSLSRRVKLADNFGKTYLPTSFAGATIDGQLTSAPVGANEQIHDLLVFEPPVEKVQFLLLELPAAAFGEPGAVYFKIPGEMIVKADDLPESPTPPGGRDDSGDRTGRPMDLGIPEIERGIEELENARTGENGSAETGENTEKPSREEEERLDEEEDPDGDVSKIMQDIDELGGGDQGRGEDLPSLDNESNPFQPPPEKRDQTDRNGRDRRGRR